MPMCKKIVVEAVPPFDFDLSARIFSDGDERIRRYEDGTFWQIIAIENKLFLVAVESLGDINTPKLEIRLESSEEIACADLKKAEAQVRIIFNLDLDLKPFYAQARKDKIMANLAEKFRGLKSPSTPTVFEALVSSIVEQQISLNVAYSMERKLIKTFGRTLSIGDKVYYAFPTPERLASASIDQMRRCGLSLRKAEYIKEVSKSIADGRLNLEKFREYDDAQEIVTELDKIRGVGVWTAELTLVRGLQKLDVVPADDLGLRRTISHYYCGGEKISGVQAREIAEKWGKWKGLASFYLIMARIMETEDSQSA